MATGTFIGPQIDFNWGSEVMPGTPQRRLMTGDSITAFFWYSTFAPTTALAQRAKFPDPGLSGPFGQVGGGATNPGIYPNSGVAGDDCVTFRASGVANRVAAYNPDRIFLMLGVNCVQHGISDATCRVNHLFINQQIRTLCPRAQLCCIGTLLLDENWKIDPVTKLPVGNNLNDPALDSKDSIIRDSVLAVGGTFAWLRNPTNGVWQKEKLLNPGHANVGILTLDGIHLNSPPGKQFMSDQLTQVVRYV